MKHLCSDDIKTHNLRHFVLALVLLSISLLTMTYCWIEGVTAISIVTDDNNKVSIDNTKLSPKVIVDGTASDSINLSQYIDNADYLFLAPAKLEKVSDGISYNLQIKNSNDDSFRPADTNDIGNNYIEFTLQVEVKKNQDVNFKFSENSTITVGEESNSHPIKVAFFVDGVYQTSVGAPFASEEAFSIKGDSSDKTYNLKVIIFADADYVNYDNFKGKTVNFDLLLEATIPSVEVSVEKVPRADIAIQYSNGSSNVLINEGESVYLPIGTEITLLDKTNYSAFGTATSGHKLDKFKINGVVSNLSNAGKYIINDSTTINATTKVRDFYIGGEGFSNWSGESWDDRNNIMSYDSSNNTVTTTIVTSINNDAKFKISMDGFNSIPNQSVNYRDSKNYSVTLNMSNDNIVSSGEINKAELSGTGNDVCVKIVAPVNTTITVTYELHTNTIRLNGVKPYTIYYSGSWEYAHYWENNGAYGSTWPGVKMNEVVKNLWSIDVPVKYNRIIFNNNNDNNKTDSLIVPGDNFIYNHSTGLWSNFDQRDKSKVYLKPASNWFNDGARFAIYVYGNDKEEWASMTDSNNDGYYEATIPVGNWTGIIFCRMNGENTDNNWNNKWNQTGDLVIQEIANCYTVNEGTWDKGGGEWSFYSN